MISKGKLVNIDGFEAETGVTDTGKKITALRLPGKVKEFSEFSPSDDLGSHPSDDPSPHYLITLKDAENVEHDVWFNAARVREV
jgi:hypothetical protein